MFWEFHTGEESKVHVCGNFMNRPGKVMCYLLAWILEGFIEELEHLEREFKGNLLSSHCAALIFLPFKCGFEECCK